MIKQEPRMDIKDLVGVAMIIIGYLFFLAVVHILAINTVGDTSSVLVTIFEVMLRVLYSAGIFIGVWLLIHFMKWLVWSTTTPRWMKSRMRGKR